VPVPSELLDDAPVRPVTDQLDGPVPAKQPSRRRLMPRPPAPDSSTLDRLRVPPLTDRLTGWLVTLSITAIAFAIRVVGLAYPNKLVFDETYYAKDAYALLRSGYERQWPDNANASIVAGNIDVMKTAASFIVHPPVGKWLIAAGEAVFGMNSFGWRVAPLVFGTLLVLITIRLVRRVSRSTLIGGVAGLLLTFDGLAFVMSRTALLDIFLAFFVVAAVACLAADRDWFRNKLADHLVAMQLPDLGGTFGPALIIRPWRIAAGLCFGLALGTKWNALYILGAFALLSLAWDMGARRVAGAGRHAGWALIRDGVPAFVSLVLLSAVVYVTTWIGWFATSGGYDRQWGSQHPDAWTTRAFGRALASFLHYQRDIWNFHTGDFIMNAQHTYRANPVGWLVLARPLGIDAVNDIRPGTSGCTGPENCLSVISAIGTPALWWGAVFALVAAAILWIGARDWRFGIPVVGVLAGWLPWFQFEARPLFFFYAIAIIPFSVMAVALCLGRLLGPDEPTDRRMIGGILGGAYVALVGANFAYLYPILTDQVLPHSKWLARMWLRSWI
jgi:dolichyl-phosphate-mannose--protein O-mannosyl transferase